MSHRTKIATCFWGAAWCKHLESFSDYENRLPRGRTCVRNGSVLHLAIEPGSDKAMVQGSSLYEESISITPLSKQKWQAIKSRCKGHIGSLIELLQGKISDEIMRVVTDPATGLFPTPSEIKLSCSCPDWASMCKHVAAVLYGIGARFDTQPELLFQLRGVDHNELIIAAAEDAALSAVEGTTSNKRRRTITSNNLNNVFGVEFESTATDVPAPELVKPTKPSSPTKKALPQPTTKKHTPTKAKKRLAFKPTATAIRKLRTQHGLMQSEFAQRIGVSTQSIVKWESTRDTLTL